MRGAKWPYTTQRWQRLRRRKLGQQPTCEECERYGDRVPAEVVDHIVRIAEGGGVWAMGNLQSLCVGCHNRKSGVERAVQRTRAWERRGCHADGTPRDPEHWWNASG
jgi:5-methylcytosine-specific restriction endonuclease McrA